MISLYETMDEAEDESRLVTEKIGILTKRAQTILEWSEHRKVNHSGGVSICKKLADVDRRATESMTLLTGLVDDERRQGVFVSIAAARLEYLHNLATRLAESVDVRVEFDRLYELFERLLDLVLGKKVNHQIEDIAVRLHSLHLTNLIFEVESDHDLATSPVL